MLVADGKVLYKGAQYHSPREGLASSPRLKSEAVARTAAAVAEFFRRAKAEGASFVCAFATAAVRTAENGAEFVSLVKESCGLEVDVISGEEEAEIGILGALGSDDGGIVDAGGASTEIIVRKGGLVLYKKSVNIGVVRLKDMCGADRNKLEEAAKVAAESYGKVPCGVPMYAIGGTATTLAAVLLEMKEYDPSRITGTVITLEKMRFLAEKLTAMSAEEIAALPGVPAKRADVLGGGAVLYCVLMDKLGFSQIVVSDSDNLEGYAKKHGLL